jgi:hypothetical protein
LTDYFKNKAKEMKDETIFNRKQRMWRHNIRDC